MIKTGGRDMRCRGFSLVELMIALTLGLVLSALLASTYLGSRRQSQIEHEIARLQENSRYVLHLLSRELRLAGFWGGMRDFSTAVIPASAADCGAAIDWSLDPRHSLDVIPDFNGQLMSLNGVLLSCLNGQSIRSGSDIVAIKRAAVQATLVDGVYASGTVSADALQWYLRLAHGDHPRWHYQLGHDFPAVDVGRGSGVDYWESYASIFFVRTYSNAGDGIPTLCHERLSRDSMGPVECLVEGVEDLQIELGLDLNGDGAASVFRESLQPTEFDQVVAARLHLLMRSLAPLAGYRSDQYHRLGARQRGPYDDSYLRRVFTVTLTLPNVAAPRVLAP
ncbi:MAG: PilW family protein [Parahaliea sp.]